MECESLRGVAILLVVLFHAHMQLAATHALQPNLLSAFVIAGNTGVTLFFVLSGFLLNLPFMRHQGPAAVAFFRNRALRIMPMYSLVVIIAGVYHRDMTSAVQALLFWNVDIKTLWPFGTVWWSLMVEVQFYLLLPLLHAIARAPRLRWLLWPILIAGCALYLLYTNRLPWKPAQFYFIVNPRDSILCLWPVFFLGGALAWLHANYRAQMIRYAAASRFLVNGGADLLFFALLLALANELLAVARMGPWAANGFNFDHIAIEGALWTLLIAAVLYLPLKTRRLWCNPLFAFFGAISYSLYLLHSCTMNLGWHFIRNGNIGELAASKPLSIALLLGIALLLSILTYALIEKPALDLKHRVGARR